MSVLESIKEKLAVIAKQKEEMVEALRKDFAPMFEAFFEKSKGKINSFSWVQYTPYFNDGDECIFGVHPDYNFKINGEDTEEMESLDWRISRYLKGETEKYPLQPEWDIELFKLVEEVQSILSSIPEEFMKDLFGDHVEVTVNSDGTIETDGYDHD